MRLLKLSSDAEGDVSLTEDLHENIPRYAILSYRWGSDNDEVTFNDINNRSGKHKAGYAKIQFCAQQAKNNGLAYFWVDTCCIDKSSGPELQEAITSMFQWYRNAHECYVYLPDVSLGEQDTSRDEESWKSLFRQSTWFTRGWTLQELLAPKVVKFFSHRGDFLGSKVSLRQLIQEITKIPVEALDGAPLSNFSIEQRLTWAEKRVTKRQEDRAHCLLGIFGVFMPLIYGEGENAFKRLRSELGKSVTDTHELAHSAFYHRELVFLRARQMRYLHTQPWVVLEEDFVTNNDAKDDHKAWSGGIYQIQYPESNPLAKTILSIDWHARMGDPFAPSFTWTIDAHQSLYFPGTHRGSIEFTAILDRFKARSIKVNWLTPIFSPFITKNGGMSSSVSLEDMSTIFAELTPLLQSMAHWLAYGPYVDAALPSPLYTFHDEMGWEAGTSKFFRQVDRDQFARASSFYARAYTVEPPDEDEFLGQEFPAKDCQEITITIIQELLQWYRKDLLESPANKATWNFVDDISQTVISQREWALAERRWADRLVEACGLKFIQRAIATTRSGQAGLLAE